MKMPNEIYAWENEISMGNWHHNKDWCSRGRKYIAADSPDHVIIAVKDLEAMLLKVACQYEFEEGFNTAINTLLERKA